MYDLIETINGRSVRAIGSEVQSRAMSPAYRVTDPVKLAGQLSEGGFDVRIVNRGRKGKLTMGGTPWRAIVLATEPIFFDRDYRRQVGFLCSHDGRTAFAAQVGVRAEGCLNQFQLAPFRVWHTDPEIDMVLADPVDFALRLISKADLALTRLDSLRSIGRLQDMVDALKPAPRLQRRMLRAVGRYFPIGRDSFWTGLQALTDTKSPTLVKLTSLALDEGWESTSGGSIPAAWDSVLN